MLSIKTAAFTAALLAVLPSLAASEEWAPPPPDNGEVSVDISESTPGLTPETFRSTLSPYGDWYASPRYGEVWRPRVAVGWHPYYYGSWLWTDEGWYWDSAEPFAWAVYHYGRWVYDPTWGWVWIPGYQWAPAWVTWRFGVDAIGWAPLGPGVSVFVTSYPFIDFWWTFVPTVDFVGVPVQRVAYPIRDSRRWFRTTEPAPPRPISGVVGREGRPAPAPAWGGPSRTFVEQRIGRPVVVERRPLPTRPGGGFERPGVGAGRREAAPGFGAPVQRPERGRPEAVPVPRGEGARPEFTPPRRDESRPQFTPPSRGEGTRPQFTPPRREESRPQFAPAPRGEEARPQFTPAPRNEGQRGGGDRGGGERGGGGGGRPGRERER